MRNPIGELGPQLLLPMRYLDEVKNAPKSLFSFDAFSEKVSDDIPMHIYVEQEILLSNDVFPSIKPELKANRCSY